MQKKLKRLNDMAKIAEQLRKVVANYKNRKDLKPESVKRMQRVSEAAKNAVKKT